MYSQYSEHMFSHYSIKKNPLKIFFMILDQFNATKIRLFSHYLHLYFISNQVMISVNMASVSSFHRKNHINPIKFSGSVMISLPVASTGSEPQPKSQSSNKHNGYLASWYTYTHNLWCLNEFGKPNQWLPTDFQLLIIICGQSWGTLGDTGRPNPALWEKNGVTDIVMVTN